MSVVINDFEIIPEPSVEETVDEETAAPAPSPVRPVDVVDIVHREERRQYRLLAH